MVSKDFDVHTDPSLRAVRYGGLFSFPNPPVLCCGHLNPAWLDPAWSQNAPHTMNCAACHRFHLLRRFEHLFRCLRYTQCREVLRNAISDLWELEEEALEADLGTGLGSMQCTFVSDLTSKDLDSFGWCDCAQDFERCCEKHDQVSLWLTELELFRDIDGNKKALKKLCKDALQPPNGGKPMRVGCGECRECIGRVTLDKIRIAERECQFIRDFCKPSTCQELDAWQVANLGSIIKEYIEDWEQHWGLDWVAESSRSCKGEFVRTSD